jgi:hypothetical protein
LERKYVPCAGGEGGEWRNWEEIWNPLYTTYTFFVSLFFWGGGEGSNLARIVSLCVPRIPCSFDFVPHSLALLFLDILLSLFSKSPRIAHIFHWHLSL